jgi:transposase-like protein
MTKKEKAIYPECGSTRIVKKGRRNNKFGWVQRYKCSSCRKSFSLRELKGRVYPARLIMEAVSLFNRGYPMSEAVKQTRRRFTAKVSKSAVDSWIKEFRNICTYWRIRGKVLRLFSPEKIIFKKTFFHQIPYKFQYHQAKLRMFVKDYFSGLARYLKDIPRKCPDRMFVCGKARGSRIKLDFPIEAKRKTNYACRLAGLALAMTKNNRERHEVVQDFMLANDTATLACEVPVYLYSREAGKFGFFKDSG